MLKIQGRERMVRFSKKIQVIRTQLFSKRCCFHGSREKEEVLGVISGKIDYSGERTISWFLGCNCSSGAG